MKAFGQGLLEVSKDYPIKSLIRNCQAKLETIDLEGYRIICTVNEKPSHSSWTISLYAMIIDYGKDELAKLSLMNRIIMNALRRSIAVLLHLVSIDKLVGIGNETLSTNLISEGFKSLNIAQLTEVASNRYPKYSFMIRSLNPHHHCELMKPLKDSGWLFLTNRQIYLIDQPELALKHKDSKKDLKLLDDGRYYFEELTHASDFRDYQDAEDLYNRLYLDKHSKSNVQFTALLLQKAVQGHFIKLYLLKDTSSHRAVGCLGMVIKDGILTVPVLGYDLDLPLSEGLYRRLSIFITLYCKKKGLRQHLSAGAPNFKRSRGATSSLEYIAIYCKHLPFYKVLAWKALAKISNGPYARLLLDNEM